MKRHLRGIAAFVIAALVISFLVPLTIGLVYSLLVERSRQEAELVRFHDNVVDSLKQAMENALLHFEPNEAQGIARMVMRDPRILGITVFSTIYEMPLVQLVKTGDVPESDVRVERRDFVANGEAVGYVEVVIDGAFQEASMVRGRRNVMRACNEICVNLRKGAKAPGGFRADQPL